MYPSTGINAAAAAAAVAVAAARHPGPPQPGQAFKFTVNESCDRIKEEFDFLQRQCHQFKAECDKLAAEKIEIQRHYVMYYEMSYGLNVEMHKQTEISKRLSAIIVQILPYLSQEHQQQVAGAVDRAKQITMTELNTIMGQHRPDIPRIIQQIHAQQIPPGAAIAAHPGLPGLPGLGPAAAGLPVPTSASAALLGLGLTPGAVAANPGTTAAAHSLSILGKPDIHRGQPDDLKSNGVLLTQGSGASKPAKSNVAGATSEDDGEERLLANMNLTMFKERYRRLIPYINLYVANNYLPTQPAQNYASELSGTLLRKPVPQPQQQQQQQHSSTRLGSAPRRGGSKFRINLPDPEKKFVPSVQFDPRNFGGDNEYFTPVKYKINFADYSTPSYELYQAQKVYPEITTPSSPVLHKENRYFAGARPLRPPVREQHLIKKPPAGSPQDDYSQDYTARPSNVAVNYPNKEFAGVRYIPVPVHATVQQQSVKPSVSAQIYRKPNVNLNNIIESFQLSEQLPEMLNKDNLDSSIKTLVEILNILQNSRQESFPQSQVLQPLPSVPPSRLTGYDGYKAKIYTRPKVVTETRFQVTPSPLLITDDPERYKTTDDNIQVKTPLQSDYNVNHVKNEKVEYYIPYVQDISNNPKQEFRPTPLPDKSVEPSYEIAEDLSDDILQDERYTLPISTEASTSHEYVAPNELTRPEKTRQPSLKYGATRGKPDVDYPAYAIIPETDFSCKNQRYKGFFGDPATRCQVWHYCDLNGGKSSFLCPNGTIFSQVALTCDWWFNVKCETTTQLYVLNERLYKYILPIMPKFPEDFTGPEVDRYLELKFKEMEAKMKEKKLKKQQEEKGKHKGKPQTTDDDE